MSDNLDPTSTGAVEYPNSNWMGANGNLNYGTYTSGGVTAVDGTGFTAAN